MAIARLGFIAAVLAAIAYELLPCHAMRPSARGGGSARTARSLGPLDRIRPQPAGTHALRRGLLLDVLAHVEEQIADAIVPSGPGVNVMRRIGAGMPVTHTTPASATAASPSPSITEPRRCDFIRAQPSEVETKRMPHRS